MKKSLPSNFSPDLAQTRKKNWVLPVILSSAGVLLLLLAAACFVFWLQPSTDTADSDAAYLEAVNNYTEVNDAVAELTNSSAYLETEPEEKANQLLHLLEQLEGEGQIASGSVQYNEGDQTISYAYADGAFGSIQLKEFSKENSGVDASYVTEYDENGLILSTSSAVSFGIDGCPYEKAPTALILCGLGDGNEDTLQTLKKDQQEFWFAEYMETALEENCTVEMFRQVLSGYDLLVLQLHGYLYNDVPTIYLQETTSFSIWNAEKLNAQVLSMEDRQLLDDLRTNRIGMMCSASDGKYHYFLLPEFFTYYYRDGQLNNTIVWLGSCSGYRNDSLVKAFADCGAKAVLGCTETVKTSYNICMEDAFAYKLLYGSTVDEALAFAKSVWGDNDSIFWWNYRNEQDTDPSEIRYYNGGDQTLVTLTAEAKAALQESEAGADVSANESSNASELYGEVLDLFYSNIISGWEDYEATYTYGDIEDVSYMFAQFYSDPTYLDSIGYTFMDVDYNGIPELMIGIDGDGKNSYTDSSVIFDLYTYANGKIVHLGSSGERYWYELCQDNTIYYQGSAGAASDRYCHYCLNPGQSSLTVLKCVWSDPDDTWENTYWYESNTGYYTGDETLIAESSALAIVNSWPRTVDLTLTPFCDYTPEGESENSALYDNSPLTVSGTLTEQSYEINSANKEVAYILELDEPVTKSLYSDDAGYAGESVEISEIQIQFTDNDDYIQNNLLGKHIQVSGSVMFANSGHHLTTILLTDVTVEVEDAEL